MLRSALENILFFKFKNKCFNPKYIQEVPVLILNDVVLTFSDISF